MDVFQRLSAEHGEKKFLTNKVIRSSKIWKNIIINVIILIKKFLQKFCQYAMWITVSSSDQGF